MIGVRTGEASFAGALILFFGWVFLLDCYHSWFCKAERLREYTEQYQLSWIDVWKCVRNK